MLNSPQWRRSLLLGLVVSSSILSGSSVDYFTPLFSPTLAMSHPLTIPQETLIAQEQEDEPPIWGPDQGGSRGQRDVSTDVLPDFNWGEPGGSRLTSEMADDLVEFYQWGNPGGSRGLLCPITPYSPQVEFAHNGPFKVWSDRPLIVWHSGDVRRIIIRDYDTNELIWNQVVDSTDTQVRYDGDPLEPDKQYVLIFAGPSPEEFLFKTLTDAEKNRVSAELTQLEDDARANGASEEQVALWRSRFFIQHELHLLYDGLDAIFSVEEPSPDLVESRTELVLSVCNLNPDE